MAFIHGSRQPEVIIIRVMSYPDMNFGEYAIRKPCGLLVALSTTKSPSNVIQIPVIASLGECIKQFFDGTRSYKFSSIYQMQPAMCVEEDQ